MARSRRPVDVEKLLHGLEIEAKRAGKEWLATCPNRSHADRHPSWRIKDLPTSPNHGSHKCHACGFGGGPIELVMEVRGVSQFSEAADWIKKNAAGEAADPVDRVRWETRALTAPRFVLPPEVDVLPLGRWPSIPRDYARSRGITDDEVDRFGIGYALEGRLAGRIVFPSRDVQGHPRNYTARSFVGARKRYLAASGDERPDTSCMFGEQVWPPLELRKHSDVAVLEGAINALAVDRAFGGRLSFATIDGSEPRPGQLAKLSTFGRVLLVTDPDAAGAKAAGLLWAALVRHVPVLRVALPAGMDAQDAGEERVREAVTCARERRGSTTTL